MNKALIITLTIVLVLAGVVNWYLFFSNSAENQSVLPNQNTTTTLPDDYSDLIKVESPQPNQVIQSPFIITGQARGTWFFEASFPVKLIDLSGNIISQTIATAKGDWMTESFVPFTSILSFEITTTTQQAVLILHNDNPSGLAENDKEVRIPVVLQNLSASQRSVQLFYYNPNLDKDIEGNVLCTRQGLAPVERQIPITQTPIQDTVRLLLKGQITSQERAKGITTEYPLEGFSLKGASLNNGVLTLTFNDFYNQTTGGSCRVGILWFQIEATAKQFSEVNEVKFMPQELFQP
ncbi:MAG: Gmad2 immunoglobulin-like domain-containing protein [Candidatus Pacebacteria bacterium]|nr:Gmad2 immunoglobulin-like domain-containing protein [Candidatus Paceibacterota bacterium]